MPIRFLKILRKTWSKSSRESRVCFLLMLMITLHPLRSTTQLAMHWEYTLHPTTTTQQSHKQEPKHTHTEPCHRKRGERECVGGVRRSSLPGLIIAVSANDASSKWIITGEFSCHSFITLFGLLTLTLTPKNTQSHLTNIDAVRG